MKNTKRDFNIGVAIFCALLMCAIVLNRVASHEHSVDCTHQIQTETTELIVPETDVDTTAVVSETLKRPPLRRTRRANFIEVEPASPELVSIATINCTTPEIIEETAPEIIEVEPIVEELPDIIKVAVKLYNEHKYTFNMVDGQDYLSDISTYLEQHAPEGMFISAACAMAYTEGGSGKEGIYVQTNNCFGITATSTWDGYVYARSDGRVYRDYETALNYGASDLFRAYDSMEDSVIDYIKLIEGNYYEDALTTATPAEYLAYLLNKGYGEQSLLSVWLTLIDLYNLDILDN